MLKKYAKTFIAACLLIPFIGCAHSDQSVQKVQVGMTKAEVLELAGNPRHTTRKHGLDVWLYIEDRGTTSVKTEVFFDEGKVKHIGEADSYQPSGATKAKPKGTFKPVGQ